MPGVANSRSLEDYSVGESGVTDGRTITEADVHYFACLTGDFNQVHINAEAGRTGSFGGRIAHGLCTATIATGLLHLHAPAVLGLAARGLRFAGIDVRYTKPVLLGDTITVKWSLKDKKADPSDLARGILLFSLSLANQKSETVSEGEITTSVLTRAAEHSSGQGPASVAFVDKSTSHPDPEKVHFYDDFVVGLGDVTGARTVTETDLVNFCCFSGNYHPMYLDREYARANGYGDRVLPEMIGPDIAFGMLYRDAPMVMGRTRGGFRGGHLGDRMQFLAPMKIGDTLRCAWRIASARKSQTRPDRGIVTFSLKLVNQRNEVVQDGEVGIMSSFRPQL